MKVFPKYSSGHQYRTDINTMASHPSGLEVSTSAGNLTMRAGGAQEARLYADQVAELNESNFVDPPLQGTYAYSKGKILETYIHWPNFKIVTLWNDDELVGFVHGGSLKEGTN